MIYLASAPFDFKTFSILHLVHPKDLRKQFILNGLNALRGQSTQICKVGESLLNDTRFNHFKTIVIHSCEDKLIHDYNRRLLAYTDRLKSVLKNHDRNLVVLGNALNIISDKMFHIDRTTNLFINDVAMSTGIDVNTETLNILQLKIDYNFELSEVSKQYLSVIEKLSRRDPIYLLSRDAVVDHTGKILRGNVFTMKQGKLESLKKLDVVGNLLTEIKKERRITPIYQDDKK